MSEASIPSDQDRIRVLYLISAIHTEQAGTEGHLLRLLRTLDRKRFEPRLVVMQRSAWTDSFAESDIPIDVLNFQSFMRPRDWTICRTLTTLFRTHRPQIVELYPPDAHFAGAIAGHRAGVPVILSCRRDLGYQYGFKERLMLRIGNRHVHRFIANAEIIANEANALENLRSDQFEIIYNGIDLDSFDQRAQKQVGEDFAKATDGKRVVTIAANLRPIKNLPLFLHAAASIYGRFEDVDFAILGDGVLRSDLEGLARSLGISDRVHFLGSVPDVAPYLQRSHVACLCSNSEGFSNSVLEYMSASLPVVVTNVGGLPEAVDEGKTGFVVPKNDADRLANAISKVLELPEQDRRVLGAAGRSRVEQQFTMQHQMSRIEATYEHLLHRVSS